MDGFSNLGYYKDDITQSTPECPNQASPVEGQHVHHLPPMTTGACHESASRPAAGPRILSFKTRARPDRTSAGSGRLGNPERTESSWNRARMERRIPRYGTLMNTGFAHTSLRSEPSVLVNSNFTT